MVSRENRAEDLVFLSVCKSSGFKVKVRRGRVGGSVCVRGKRQRRKEGIRGRINLADRENNKVKCQKQEVTDYNLMEMVVLRMCGGGINRNIKFQGRRGQRKKKRK